MYFNCYGKESLVYIKNLIGFSPVAHSEYFQRFVKNWRVRMFI